MGSSYVVLESDILFFFRKRASQKKIPTGAAFDDKENPYLMPSVLWRQKEQFSDGVGYNWIDSLKAHANESISDQQMKAAKHRFPHNTPGT